MFNRLRKIKKALYEKLVSSHLEVSIAYESYVDAHKKRHQIFPILSWFQLLRFQFQFHILKKVPRYQPRQKETTRPVLRESSLCRLPSPEQLASEFADYDVIAFDLFDTLLLRPLQHPTDLFYLVGEQLGYPNFKALRIEAEKRARQEKRNAEGTDEVTLSEIYRAFEQLTGFPAEQALACEWETGQTLCYENPYMKRLFNLLQQQQHSFFALSDTYYPEELLKLLLQKNGYTAPIKIFSSCSLRKAKHNGSLYAMVNQILPPSASKLMIGDHPVSDIKMARQNGFAAFQIPNISETGNIHRPTQMSPIFRSAYCGIVNAKFCSGLSSYSAPYEYGYAVGGIVVLGYCRFIHRIAKERHADQLLFLARDGAILKKVYDQLYPNEATRYVYYSRFASLKLVAAEMKTDFFRRFVTHKEGTGCSFGEALDQMELNFLRENQSSEWQSQLLTHGNAKQLISFLQQNWSSVVNAYQSQREAAQEYFRPILNNPGNILAIDVGWAGSGAVSLAYLSRYIWEFPCNIIGILAGSNTPTSDDWESSVHLFACNKLVSYLFGPAQNIDLLAFHNAKAKHNIYFEFLLTSTEGSLKYFGFSENGTPIPILQSPEIRNQTTITEIQNGILDFVRDYQTRFRAFPYLLDIPGRDAYEPFRFVASASGYLPSILKNCDFQEIIGENSV